MTLDSGLGTIFRVSDMDLTKTFDSFSISTNSTVLWTGLGDLRLIIGAAQLLFLR